MGKRIVIIEDNPANLDLMSYLLTAFGHMVSTAVDGKQGLDTVGREMPDLIVCDVQIPKVDGYGVAQQLKQHPALGEIPLIAVTVFAMVGDRDKLLAAGFDGYIPKPINPETFVREVEAFLPAIAKRPYHPAPSPVVQEQRPSNRAARGTILVVDDSPLNLSLMRMAML